MTLLKNKIVSPLICTLEYIFPEDVQSLENVELSKVRIEPKPGKSFLPIYATPGSFSYNENPTDEDKGYLFRQVLKVYYPGVEPDTFTFLYNIERRKAIYRITFQNDNQMIVGSMDVPASLKTAFQADQSVGTVLTITCDSDERTRFLVE